MTNSQTRLLAKAYGRVQDVHFRDFLVYHAHQLGVSGYVRNLPSGTAVELVAEGERAKLECLLEQMHRGPPAAWVGRVERKWLPSQHEFLGFSIRW